MQAIERLVAALRSAGWKERDPIKAELMVLAGGPDGVAVREQLEAMRKSELLEVQWEIEEVLEATTPKKPVAEAPAPPKPVEPPPPPEDPNRPLTAKDLVLVYDDPRGLVLHKSKVGDRWFATQVDPRTGQPQTFELHPQEVGQVKQQLANSPYWVLGAGVAGGAGKTAGAPGAPAAAAPRPAPKPPVGGRR